MRPIYLDYNATTPLAPPVQEAMLPFLADQYGHPFADHALGRAAAQAIEDARSRVASAIGASAHEIYFCSGATESCHTALAMRPRWAVTTTVDHHAVRQAPCGEDLTVVSVPASGVVSPEAVVDAAVDGETLVSVVHANSEVGLLQPVERIASLLEGRGVLLHTDASQSFGKVKVDVNELGVDLLTLTSHKCYGPKGVGALYVRDGAALKPPQSSGPLLRPGTPSVAAIAGFGAAAELASRSVDEAAPRLAGMIEQLVGLLRSAIGEELIIWGEGQVRLPNTVAVAMPGVSGAEVLSACPELCATPLACGGQGGVSLSPTLRAMGVDPQAGSGSVRLSAGWHSEPDDIERAASLLIGAWERLSG
ncbi:Cysteine desulfurase [Posidoniimonas polymericola]|uniref:cysteine desulfurase n=1 Tax=Posidoniimonas polymericola TaxID=2528002 RepID=A0A5C5YH44_9BACT|nr:aminotransferase class V-fold PLP-dependent enzyme [Posidoniimonas polymericola]TWT74554.1 Cysteine desulfurase [Posidoniimonas polymericola]